MTINARGEIKQQHPETRSVRLVASASEEASDARMVQIDHGGKGLATTARVPSKVRRTVFTEASSNRTNGAPEIDQAQARPDDKPVLDVAEARS